MNEYGCKHCKEICQVYKISQPSNLKKAIRVIRDNIGDGTIIGSDFWPDQYLKTSTEPFSQIQDEGPLDDVLIYYFECTKCKQLFKLCAETYHGNGGSWGPINKDSS